MKNNTAKIPKFEARTNVIPFPARNGVAPIEVDLLDVNELITGGNSGVKSFLLKYDAENFGLKFGDIVFVDSNDMKPARGKIIFVESKGVRFLTAKEKFDGDCLGTVRWILRNVGGRQ